MKNFLLAAVGFWLLCQPAYAAEPVALGSFGDWKAFHFTGAKGKVCFISSQPQKQEGNFTRRGEVFFFVTHWQDEKNRDVVSISTGYPYKSGSRAKVTIDDKTYEMFTEGEMAWADDTTTDAAISSAIQKGSKLVVEGVSQRGTKTTDTYSLTGTSEAYKAITQECGL